jgi:hypothetical protein
LERALERLRHSKTGSKIEAARKFGIDLALLLEKLQFKLAEPAARMGSIIDSARRFSRICSMSFEPVVQGLDGRF